MTGSLLPESAVDYDEHAGSMERAKRFWPRRQSLKRVSRESRVHERPGGD